MNAFKLASALATLPGMIRGMPGQSASCFSIVPPPPDISMPTACLPQQPNLFRQREFTRNVIAYEGVRRNGLRPQDVKRVPCACGDPLGGRWQKDHEYVTDFSLYGSSHVGLLGAIVGRTSDEKILKISCTATDFSNGNAFPTYLLYNPYADNRDVFFDAGEQEVSVHDVIQQATIKHSTRGSTQISLEANAAKVLVVKPVFGTKGHPEDELYVDDAEASAE